MNDANDAPYYLPIGDEVAIFTAAYGARLPILLKGPTGCGKTRFVEYMARTLGATRFQVYRTIIMPAIIPGLIGAVRVALGSSWAIVLAAEYLSVQSGLGRLMILSEMFFFTGRMVVVVILFIIYSVILNLAFLLIARRVTRWMPGRVETRAA